MKIAPFLEKNQTLILRSTVSPRTTEYVKLFINDIKGIEVGKNFFLAFCFTSSRLASLFTVTNDSRYKDRLVKIADKEIIGYNGQATYPIRNIQLAWSIYVPAYNITKDRKYLAAAERVFDNFDVAAYFSENWSASAVKAGDVLLSLADISEKGSRYKKQARDLLQLIIDERWDTPESTKFTGDYGFVDAFAVEDKPASKASLFNGWLLKLFVLMKDEKFKQPITTK